MKACPHCASNYSDRIEFCFHDGSALEASATASPTTSAAEPWDLPTPSRFDLPAPPPQTRRAQMTPTPLAPFAMPMTQVSSPLAKPPPPPANEPATPPPAAGTTPTPVAPVERAPVEALTPTPSPVARSTPPPALVAEDSDASDDNDGIPLWIWWTGLGVAAVALVGATLFAAGGLGLLGAATASRTKPPIVAVQAQPPVEPTGVSALVDDDRFPEAPLEVGVISDGTDSDTEGDTQQDTAAGAEPTLSTIPTAPDPTEPGTADDPGDPQGSAPAAPMTVVPVGPPPQAIVGPADPTPAPLVVGPVPGAPTVVPPVAAEVPPTTAPTTPSGGPGQQPAPVAETVSDSPWGPVANGEAAAENAGTVLVFLQGDATGLELVVDGKLRSGTFPHTLQLSPGAHRFRVQDGGGKSYEIGKTIAFDGDSAMRVMLIAP